MKLSVAAPLALLASSIANVSAVYGTDAPPCLYDGSQCCKFMHVDDVDGEVKIVYTTSTDKQGEYSDLALDPLSGYSDVGEVLLENCDPCDITPCDQTFHDLDLEECEDDEHDVYNSLRELIATDMTRECEFGYPKVEVCTKTLSFDHDGKKAVSSWKTTKETIVRRNLRAGRHLSDVEVSSVSTGACDLESCDENCPLELIDNDIKYTRDEDACSDNPVRGRCTYTNLLYTIDTDEDTNKNEDLPCVDVCVIKNKSVEQECFDPTKAEECDGINCYVGLCTMDYCNALCPIEKCTVELGGTEGYECNDPVDEDHEEPKPKKDLTTPVCWEIEDNIFKETTLGDVVDESRNSWRYGNCKDPKNEKYFCKRFPMVIGAGTSTFHCGQSRR